MAVNISIRGINESVIKSLDQAAAKRDLSREEYLRQCLRRIAYDDRALEGRYALQLQKLTQCINSQQEQLKQLMQQMLELEGIILDGGIGLSEGSDMQIRGDEDGIKKNSEAVNRRNC